MQNRERQEDVERDKVGIMKRVALIISMLVATATMAFAQAGSTKRVATKEGPQMTFVGAMSHDFGDFVVGGDKKTYAFEFVNDGTAPVVIVRVASSCKCISVKYPRRPIPPQGKGAIEVTYDPKEEGVFNKGVHINSNIEGGVLTLFVKGVVK